MAYIVLVKKKVLKGLGKLPEAIQERFAALLAVLRQSGPTGPHTWPNYSKLAKNEYHCHLSHHYVACWRYEGNNLIIEVYYVGSREGAPY